jgi:hypothetical protein
MTHDELLIEINRRLDVALYNGDAQSIHALRAIVELHKPCEPVSDDQFVTCETCNYEYHREYPWPCKTIQAIEKELG